MITTQNQFRLVMPIVLFALGITTWSAEPSTPTAALPEVTVTACRQPPLIDGILTDACWQTAPAITNMHILKPGGMSAQQIWLARDPAWLYVACAIRHPDPKRIAPKCMTRDGGVGADDSIEVYLDPGTESAMYLHLKLNAANIRADQRVVVSPQGFQKDPAWDLPWRSATRITDQGWNAELAIPLAELAANGDLDRARANFCVNIVEYTIDQYGVVVGDKRTWLSWASVIASFNEPERFGRLAGLKPDKVTMPFLPFFKGACAGAYRIDGSAYSYPVTLTVRNNSLTKGAVDVEVCDQPLVGQSSVITQRVEFAGNEKKALNIAVPVASLCGRNTGVVMKDPATGEILQSGAVTGTEALTLMEAYLDRNYYTDEAEAVVVCSVGLPELALTGMSVAVADATGRFLAKNAPVMRESHVVVPVKEFPAGTHKLTVSLCGADNQPLFSKELALIKRAPHPALEVKIDRLHRCVLRNGKPVLPFGVVFAASTEEDFALMAEMGFNCFVHWDSETTPAKLNEFLAWSDKYNLDMIPSLDYFQPAGTSGGRRLFLKHFKPDPKLPPAEAKKQYEELYRMKLDTVRAAILKMKEHPRVLAYFSIDEPEDSVYGALKDYYELAHAADPYRPVHLNTGSYKTDDVRDILGGDPYWCPASAEPRRNQPTAALRYCYGWPYRDYIRTSEKLRMPLWMVPCGEYWSGTRKRAYLPEEQVSQTYLLLIHGVRGVFYFVYPFRHEKTGDVFRRLAREVKQLTPALLTRDIPQTVKYTPGEMDPENGNFPDVHVVLRSNPDGGYILLAANSKYYPVDVNYRLDLLGKKGRVTRLFGPEKYNVCDGAFEDRLESCGVRAYVIGSQTTDDGRRTPACPPKVEVGGQDESKIENRQSAIISLAVTMTARPELITPEPVAVPDTGRPGRKNLVPNPGFEQATFPGWPDYMVPFYYCLVGPVIGGPDSRWFMDPADPFEGKSSLRMKVNEHRISSFRMGFSFNLVPKTDSNQPVTFSVYLKARGKDMKAQLFGPGMEKPFHTYPPVSLTETWQRYSITTTISPQLQYGSYGLVVYGEGTVWADAAQVEKGAEATEFEP